MQKLSLWNIDHELEALTEYQRERLADTELPPSPEELGAMLAYLILEGR